MERSQLARLAAIGALVLGVLVVGWLLITGGSTYVVHARFYDAGQLVRGDLVTVAGHQVGAVGDVSLSPDGMADIQLNISDDSITPLHSGTLATIGQLSLTGVANRFVGLTPSSAGRPIRNGGVLPAQQTRGIVDLDVLLDALNPAVRQSIQQTLRTGAYFVQQPTASQLHAGLPYLNPAFSQTAQLAGEVVADKFALQRLVSTAASVTSALAAHGGDLSGAVTNTAATLREVATQRGALQDLLVRAPGVLSQARGVLADVNFALRQLNPTLIDLRPLAPKLVTLLQRAVPAARDAIPTVNGIEALVAPAKAALQGFPPVERQATPAVKSLTSALIGITPILAGLRPYSPDVVAGFFNGVGGATGGSYDANGHYLKSELVVQPGGSTLTGLLNLLGPLTGALGPFNGERTGLVAPCPGGGNPPAADGSSPWTNPDVFPGTALCNPADDQRP